VTDISVLHDHPALRSINLANTSISEASIEAFAVAKPDCKIIRR